MPVSHYINTSIEKGSFIRKMFEQGAQLKAKFGADNVFDFSLGNPDLDPPAEFFAAARDLLAAPRKGMHGYMPNAGYPDVRDTVAAKVSLQQDIQVGGTHTVMTCGAAGGMNIIFKTILDPGDQVIVPRPCFVEYGFYIANHGGEMVLVDTNDDFSLNMENIRKAITPKTRAVLICSPNNPTGRVYPEKQIIELGKLIEDAGKKRPVYLIADEPYRELVYDGVKVPSIFKHCTRSIITTSYSKTLSIPGERIGYVAVNPSAPGTDKIMAGLILANRILGFVNAPALMQRVIARLTDVTVDIETYRTRRNLFMEGLTKAGYEVTKPEGAFYIFGKSPIADDVAFINHLVKYNILAVPGSGFAGPGYFRVAYCVPEDTITRSMDGFKKALETL